MRADEIEKEVNVWAPELADSLNKLAYLGSESSVKWLTDSEWAPKLKIIIRQDGYAIAAEMWRHVLRDSVFLSTPALLLILEHMRRNPAGMGGSLAMLGLEFSKSLANVAYRVADALHDGAKDSFAGDEIDVAIARFQTALSEFRFAIESQLLSDRTRRIATGKYATAVAMTGRWINVPSEAVSRALQYSQDSMNLGNLQPETLVYRLELLVLQFDQTGNNQLLRDALELLSANRKIAEGTELAEAEARFRLAQLSVPEGRDARRYLEATEKLLARFRPKSGVEEARLSILTTLAAEVKQGRLAASARSMAVPKGLLALMATEPSFELWETIRRVINGLEVQRKNRGWVPAAVLSTRFLRQMVDGPAELLGKDDLSRYVEITGWLSDKASWNRHAQWEAGAAALSAAKRTGNMGLAYRAQEIFEGLAASHSTWPLPRIGIARVRDYLVGNSGEGALSADDSWREAAKLALNSAVYARSNLGGRNEVFAVADARGFLSETFVFKRTTEAKAVHEKSMLNALRDEISQLGDTNKFEVPRSLAIVELPSVDDRRWVHVSQRAAGRLVSDMNTEDVSAVLEPIVDLLAVFHRVAGSPAAGKSAWRSLKEYLKMWSRTLFEQEQADRFVESLRGLFPGALPLVRKRDGHASNWLVDPAGRVVAIDLESVDFVPIGYDVAQLIEDNALVQADRDGWHRRLAIMTRYLEGMKQELSDTALTAAYGWFALTRALRLGTEKEAGKQLRRHARELCGMLVEFGDDATKGLARELLLALSRVEHSDTAESVPSHDHRRLSKAMAYLLRHHGPTKGVQVDNAGFASMDELALALGVDSSKLLAVAEHPGEPRFEIRDDSIRALYGHSLNVIVDVGIRVGVPTCLYHGSSWSALDSIARDGLISMQRRVVHLTNIVEEAMAVGLRKGAAIVLVVAQSEDEEPVAEGIWVSSKVLPHRLSIVNPFAEEAGRAR
ncbi:RNA 2'-phosphotransferase [Comamonas sp. 17RB]|uniref:RNA 2'-phosphotransferase n=1 Tax=Comamonas sp. 17RB TaxID=3047025 RepID=UPI0024B86727|nr:RNA 2'-phosphotransferase [Comamonas sp. 17RB]MDI9854076.1 RNA 2'-phosphotransferase [Comamonas sp. 17RB]